MTDPEAISEIKELIYQLETEGRDISEDTDCISWRDEKVDRILFSTEDESKFLVEIRPFLPCLITRISEKPSRMDYDGPFLNSFQLLRKPGNPDRVLEIGKIATIVGLSLTSDEFDPDSIFDTGRVISIKAL